MKRVLTGALLGVGLVAGSASAQSTTSTVLSGDAFGFVLANSTTPDAFTFLSQTGVNPNGIVVVSNIVTISGITEAVTASVADLGTGGDPKISVNGGVYTAGPVTINEGDSIRVSLLPVSGVYSSTYQAQVTVGDGSSTFTVSTRAADTTPNAFTFVDATNQEPGVLVTSAAVSIGGIEAPVAVSVSGTGSPQFSLDNGVTWGTTGSVSNGGTVMTRLTSGTFGETRSATVAIGGVSDAFDVTTRASNDTPVLSAFADQTGVEPGVTVTSAAITVTGLESTVTASVSGDGLPEFRVNGGPWVSAGSDASVANNDTIEVRLTSGTFGDAYTATLNVNGVTGDFNVTTRAADTTPDGFTITAVTGAEAATLVTSDPVTISGIEAPASVSVSGSGTPQFSTDNGVTWVGAAGSGTIASGGDVIVRLTSGSYGQELIATLDVGGQTADFSVTVRAQDVSPDLFAFSSALGAADALVTSSSETLSGFDGAVAISVSGDGSPAYSIDGGAFTSAPGTVSSGQGVRVRLTAATTEGATRTATLSVGTGSGDFSVTTQDLTPAAITFAAVTGAEPSTVIASSSQSVSGITGNVPISVSAGAQYQIDGGVWTSSAGTVSNGQTVAVRITSSSLYETARVATLTVGTATSDFSVTTRAQDATPDAFSFDAQLAAASTVVTAGPVSLTGFEGSVAITVSGDGSPLYSLDGVTFTADAGTVTSGDEVYLRLTSAAAEGAVNTATLSVGTGSADLVVTTQDATPDAFSFVAVTDAGLSALTSSDTVTITGITGDVAISISGDGLPAYSIDGGSFTSAPGTINSGQTVAVRLTSSASAETARVATLTVGSGSGTFSVTTAADPVVVTLNTGTIPDGEANTVYAGFDFTTLAGVSGGPVSDPAVVGDLSWTVTAGALPNGLSLSSTGALSGTPTEFGAFSFTVTAETGSASDSQAYSIIVNDPSGSTVVEGG